jgi:ribonuclease HII
MAQQCFYLRDYEIEGVNDRKKLSAQKRERLFDEITACARLCGQKLR